MTTNEDVIHDTLWRIIEVFGEPVSGSQRHEIDRLLADALSSATARGAAQAEQEVKAIAGRQPATINDDYPSAPWYHGYKQALTDVLEVLRATPPGGEG